MFSTQRTYENAGLDYVFAMANGKALMYMKANLVLNEKISGEISVYFEKKEDNEYTLLFRTTDPDLQIRRRTIRAFLLGWISALS